MPTRLAALAALAVLIPSVWADDKPDTLQTVHKSLELTEVEPGEKGPFKAGDKVTFTAGLKNKGKKDLSPPLQVQSGGKAPGERIIGVAQSWVERLGDDPAIPAITAKNPRNATQGRKYATGGQQITAPETIKAGDVFKLGQRKLDTTDYPRGKYRYYIEFRDTAGKVLQTKSVDFELK